MKKHTLDNIYWDVKVTEVIGFHKIKRMVVVVKADGGETRIEETYANDLRIEKHGIWYIVDVLKQVIVDYKNTHSV